MSGAVVALSGGVGGAKLALGLARVLAPGGLTVIANTGDDFTHLGFAISPDIDTVLYTLAGLADPAKGWGRKDETWAFMEMLAALGAETWFQLGDKDLALHALRSEALRRGETLSAVTARIARALGVATRVLPMSDDPVRTRLKSQGQWLDFQDYFVRRRCVPVVEAIAFEGAGAARPAPGVLGALARDDLAAIVLCPSNPLISIEPILAVPGIRDALRAAPAPVIAVSPLIGGKAVKGPTAKLMGELGLDITASAVAARYGDILDAFALDEADAASPLPHGVKPLVTKTLMVTLGDREALARAILESVR